MKNSVLKELPIDSEHYCEGFVTFQLKASATYAEMTDSLVDKANRSTVCADEITFDKKNPRLNECYSVLKKTTQNFIFTHPTLFILDRWTLIFLKCGDEFYAVTFFIFTGGRLDIYPSELSRFHSSEGGLRVVIPKLPE